MTNMKLKTFKQYLDSDLEIMDLGMLKYFLGIVMAFSK